MVTLVEKYKPLYDAASRYFIITGGRGSAKSFTVADFLLKLSYEPGHNILFSRYTMVSAGISVIPEFQDKIDRYELQDSFDVNQHEITNKHTGSKIIFKGIKTSAGIQTANLKSLQGITTFVLEEAEELVDERIFDKIDLSIRSTTNQNRVILILNPATREHFIYKRFFEERGVEAGFNGIKDNACYIHTTYKDNLNNISTSYLEQINHIQEHNPDKYKFEILGGWRNKAEGVIFENWEYGEFDDSLQSYYGLDFGFKTDPDACVRVAIDNKRAIVYLEEMFYKYGQTIEEVSAKVKELPQGIIVADSAEQRLIDFLRRQSQRHILAVKKGAGSVLEGVKLVQNYKLMISGESSNLVKELNNYQWSDKAKVAPQDSYNHLIDSLRYVVWTYANKDFKQLDIVNNPNKPRNIFNANKGNTHRDEIW